MKVIQSKIKKKRYEETMKIGEELYDEEYQLIPNRLKEFEGN